MTDRTVGQEYLRWNPDLLGPGFFELNHYSRARHGLVLELFYPETKKFLRLRCEHPLVSRVIDQEHRALQFQHQDLSLGIYVVLHSDLVHELVSESLGVLFPVDLIHYLIVTSRSCVDIVTLKSVELEVLLP